MNLLIKFNLIQYIFIIACILGKCYSHSRKRNSVIRGDPIYRKMKSHNRVSRYVKRLIEHYQMNPYHLLGKYDLLEPLEEMRYLYFFRSKNLLVYFFQDEEEEVNKIYFEGVNEIGDLKYLSFPHHWFNEYTLQSIHENLSEKGFLFQIRPNGLYRLQHQPETIFSSFHYLNKHLYQKSGNGNSNSNVRKTLEIEGYSMGGVLSQIFVYILLSKKYLERYPFQIRLYIIESWWGGNRDFYQYLSSHVEIQNVICLGSILYYYNLFIQNYFRVNHLIHFPLQSIYSKYLQLPFPLGISEYFGDHHYISRFLHFIR